MSEHLLLLAAAASARPADSVDTVGIDGWREDLHHLEEELPRRHVSAFHTMSRDRFDRRLQRLWERARAPAYDDHRMVMGEVMEVLGVTNDRESARFVFRKDGRR